MIRNRTGNYWLTTVIEYDDRYVPDHADRRPGDRLIAMAQTAADAERIVQAFNAMERT